MDKAQQMYYSMDSTKGIANRVVFQLNLLEDKLIYCFWNGSSVADRTESTIDDFQKALHNCCIVHPADIATCDRILQTQADGVVITTSEVRVRKGLDDYPRYRMYTISTSDAQGKMVSINGVLEDIQTHKAMTRRLKEQAQQDSLFRQAVTCNSVLSMGFDYITGKRMKSDQDILPKWMPEEFNLKNMVYSLFAQTVHPEDQYKLEALFEQKRGPDTLITTQPFYCDCKLRDISRQTQDYRWYRVSHSFTGKTPKQLVYFYITIMDIQEIKLKELQIMEQSMYDQTTGMLHRCAFENQITNWLQRMQRETVYTHLCAVIILVENPIEISNQYGNAYLTERISQLGKTVKAFIHPHEICCKYGLGEFSMALAANSKETLDERLKMLQFVCNAQKADHPSVRIIFGCNLVSVAKSEPVDFFLEKAYQAVLSIRNTDDHTCNYIDPLRLTTQNLKSKRMDLQNSVPHIEVTRNVFIRTFGHFDVFVDGEAVLFNHPKAKELFALLVDRKGGFVSANEAISCLWEDEPANSTTLARCRKAALHMKQTLTRYGIEKVIQTVNGKRRVLVELCDCDYYHYLNHSADASRKTISTYMSEYSWAENSIASE